MRPTIVLLLLLLSPAARAADLPPLLRRDDLAADVDVLQNALETLHPGLYRYNTPEQMRSHFATLRSDLSHDQSLQDAYLAISRFTASIKCGHTYPNFYNQPKAIRQALFQRSNRVPFEFRWLEGRMIVTRNLSSDASLIPGTEILSIDGVAVSDILRRLTTIARADGNNDAKRIALLEVQGTEEYETFDIYLPMFFPQVDGTHALRVRGPKSSGTRSLSVPAIGQTQRLAARREAPAADEPAWTLQVTQDNLAVLRMPTWALYDSKWDWRSFLQTSFGEIARRKPAALIIDLRGNEGGLDAGSELLAHLIAADQQLPESQNWVRYRKVPDDLAPYLDTWDPSFKDWGDSAVRINERFFQLKRDNGEQATLVRPKGPRFGGRVFVLVGASNSSATFEFAQQVQRLRLGTLVGQSTGGNQQGINGGAFFFLRLPHSRIEVDVPLIWQFLPGTHPDAGIAPDLAVSLAVTDIAADRDAEMAAVRKALAESH